AAIGLTPLLQCPSELLPHHASCEYRLVCKLVFSRERARTAWDATAYYLSLVNQWLMTVVGGRRAGEPGAGAHPGAPANGAGDRRCGCFWCAISCGRWRASGFVCPCNRAAPRPPRGAISVRAWFGATAGPPVPAPTHAESGRAPRGRRGRHRSG